MDFSMWSDNLPTLKVQDQHVLALNRLTTKSTTFQLILGEEIKMEQMKRELAAKHSGILKIFLYI